MKKVGQVLSEERVKRKITLEQVVHHTKIRKEFIIAIEANEFEKLPAAPFVKGFLHTYSEFLRMDPDVVLAMLRRDFKTGEKGEIIPREYLKPISRKKVLFTPKFAAAASGVTFLCVILLYAGFFWWRLRQPPTLRVELPEDGQLVGKTVLVQGTTLPDVVIYVESKPIAISANGEFETTVFFPENGEYAITIIAEDRNQRQTVIQRQVKVEE